MSDFASGIGRTHGTSSRQPFDRWFRYPAGFATDYVAKLLQITQLSEGSIVDPFAGSGVTGTASRDVGLAFVGLEAHPMIAELASLKFPSAELQGDQLLLGCQEVARRAQARSRRVTPKQIQNEPELVQRSFDPETLRTLIALRKSIDVTSTPGLYFKWALLATLRDVANVKVGWPYQRPALSRRAQHKDAIARFVMRVEWMQQDLATLQGQTPQAQITVGDSTKAPTWDGVNANGSVSSPPYLNNFDYADATRLESHFWGYTRTWREMTGKVRADMLTATTQQSSRQERSEAEGRLDELGKPAAEIRRISSALESERSARGVGGKRYDQVVAPYFVAVGAVLENLRSSLDGVGRCAWLIGDSAPYGVYVDTPRLIGEIAETVGFHVEEDVAVRSRGMRWPSAANRHNSKLTERIVIFRLE